MENKDFLEIAKSADSPEALVALAKENGCILEEEQAKVYFERFGNSGELSDEELDNISGGCGDGDIEKKNTGLRCCKCNHMIRMTYNKKTHVRTWHCGCGDITRQE